MKTLNKFLEDHLFSILLLLFSLAYMVVIYFYLTAQTVPPRWDDSMYLQHSEIIFNAIHGHVSYHPAYYNLTTTGNFNLASLYLHLLGGIHAPLITLLPIPFYFVFGTGFPGVAATFLALILAFHLIFYRFVSEIADQKTALLAVVITSTMPLAVGLSRYFAVEYGLMILVTLWVYLQIKSNHFRQARYNILLAIVFGLGMLMKITFPVYVTGPILWGLLSVVVETKSDKKELINVLRNGMIVLLAGLGLMSTWYIPNIKPVLTFAFNAGFGGPAQNYSMGNPLDLPVLLSYWLRVINIAASAYYFFVFGLVVLVQGVLYFFSKRQSAPGPVDSRRTPIGIMLAWFLVPLIIFSLGVNKDARYMLPALPPIGFLIARHLMNTFYKNHLGKAVIVLTVAFPCFLFAYTSLPLSSTYSLRAGPFLLLAPEIGWASRPISQSWPLERILITINEDASKDGTKQTDAPVSIGIVPNYQYFNINNLGYFAAHHRLPFTFELFRPPLNGNWTVQKDMIVSKEYLITKTGDQGPSFAYNPYLTPLLLNGELPFNELARFKLPDGTDGIIYKHGVVSNRQPSILNFVRNIKLGDQFGLLTVDAQNKLFVHPGLTTPTQFELDTAAFTKEKGQKTIRITGAMHPDVPEEAAKSGGASVRLIVQVDNQTVIDRVVDVDKPLNTELAVSSKSPVLFIVENNGNPNTDWFLLSIE